MRKGRLIVAHVFVVLYAVANPIENIAEIVENFQNGI